MSAWLKCHHPDVFLAALLNSQPMGFYAPAQLVRDAREHGVTVLPVDVTRSDWDSTLEGQGAGLRPVRLGFNRIGGLSQADALSAITGHRHQAAWSVAGIDTRATPLLRRTRTHEAVAALPAPSAAATVLADYRALGLSLTQHPVALLRACSGR